MRLTPIMPTRSTGALQQNTRKVFQRLILALMLLLFALVVFHRAWVSDDAYITFRTVDNFVSGYRLTWNVTERVQAYTHPLWMFLLSAVYFFTHEIYLSSIFTSLIVSVAAVGLYAYAFRAQFWRTFSGLLALTFSNAFVDYSTSGLENPLSHLLLAVFIIFLMRPQQDSWKLVLLSGAASLAAVNRHDTILLYLPLLIGLFFEKPTFKCALLILAGQLPLIAWEIFSLFYYGFLFPNTAYAKLNTGIPTAELLRQGVNYFLDSLARDPLTLIIIASALVSAVIYKGKYHRLLAVGLALYLAYVLRIGGDFMSGRFFSLTLFAALLVWALIGRPNEKAWLQPAFTLVLLAMIVSAPVSTLRLTLPQGVPVSSSLGVTDERAWYYDGLSLWRNGAFNREPGTMGREEGLKARDNAVTDLLVVPASHIGVMGYYAGPGVYIIDQYALADALLARLPAAREVSWYSGHFKRVIPEGYLSTIYSGESQLVDTKLSAYYDALQLAIQAPLLSPGRLQAIIDLNLGRLDGLIDRDAYRYPQQVVVELDADELPRENGAVFADGIPFGDSGILINFSNPMIGNRWAVSLSDGEQFSLLFYSGHDLIHTETIVGKGQASQVVTILAGKAASAGIDRIRILPDTPTDNYQLFTIAIDQ